MASLYLRTRIERYAKIAATPTIIHNTVLLLHVGILAKMQLSTEESNDGERNVAVIWYHGLGAHAQAAHALFGDLCKLIDGRVVIYTFDFPG